MMDQATLPCETALTPVEEARQCLIGNVEISDLNKEKNNQKVSKTFKNYKTLRSESDHPSQPYGLRHRERLLWLQTRRKTGLWAQCDSCNRWRYLPQVVDRYELPAKWHCDMNPDTNLADCSIPEVPIDLHDEEDLIHSRFTAGSVVWARLPGWPWWPAMVDDCPDTEQFYWLDGFTDIPTYYNVTFFDKSDVTRAWVPNERIKSYYANKKLGDRALNINKYAKRLTAAMKQAGDALELPLSARLQKYSFLTRYKGNISTPTKISKAELAKYRKLFKRKFDVEFPSDSSDTENNSPRNVESKTNDEPYSDTPRNARAKRIKPKQIIEDDNYTNFSYNVNDDAAKSLNVTMNVNQLDNTNDKVLPETVTPQIVEENDTQPIPERTISTASDDFDF